MKVLPQRTEGPKKIWASKPKTFMKTNQRNEPKGTMLFLSATQQKFDFLSIQDTKEIMNISFQNLMNLGGQKLVWS